MDWCIVYAGPDGAGATTNLRAILDRARPEGSTPPWRSVEGSVGEGPIDYLHLDLGAASEGPEGLCLFTLPGGATYTTTRRLLLRQATGIVFVADSRVDRLTADREAWGQLEEDLRRCSRGPEALPCVIEYNKQDLPDALPPMALDRHLNSHGRPSLGAIAPCGVGVFDALTALGRAIRAARIPLPHLGPR